QAVDRIEGQLVVDPSKRLTTVERLSVAVELTMVVGLEALLTRELAREQAGGERHAGQDTHLAARGLFEQELERTLAEHVEDDLNGLNVRILERLQALFHALHADAVVAQLALPHELVEDAERLRLVVDAGRRAMQLQQVQRLDLEVEQAALHETGQVAGIVA